MTDWAAALTYYGLLSLFPALIALVSIIGLFADPASTTEKLTDIVSNLGPDTAADTFSGPVESLTSNRGASGVTFVLGPRPGDLVRIGLHRRLQPRLQRHLRNPGRPAVLEAPPDPARGHPGDDPDPRAAGDRAGHDRARSSTRSPSRSASARPRSTSGASPSGR